MPTSYHAGGPLYLSPYHRVVRSEAYRAACPGGLWDMGVDWTNTIARRPTCRPPSYPKAGVVAPRFGASDPKRSPDGSTTFDPKRPLVQAAGPCRAQQNGRAPATRVFSDGIGRSRTFAGWDGTVARSTRSGLQGAQPGPQTYHERQQGESGAEIREPSEIVASLIERVRGRSSFHFRRISARLVVALL